MLHRWIAAALVAALSLIALDVACAAPAAAANAHKAAAKHRKRAPPAHDPLADRYLDIEISGDTADVTSKIPDKPLQMRMTRVGDHWQVVGVEDKDLADKIAQTVGQQIIAVASGASIGDSSKKLGIKNLQDVLKRAEDLLR